MKNKQKSKKDGILPEADVGDVQGNLAALHNPAATVTVSQDVGHAEGSVVYVSPIEAVGRWCGKRFENLAAVLSALNVLELQGYVITDVSFELSGSGGVWAIWHQKSR